MARFEKSFELEGKTLSHGNTLILSGLKYSVGDSFLNNSRGSNDEIFEILGIEDPMSFCSRYYGYVTEDGNFPQSNEGDYIALTKVTVALMKLSEIKTVKDAIKECSCVKEDPRTISLVTKALSVEKSLQGKKPDDQLNGKELQQVRELFNSAEDIFYPNSTEVSTESLSLNKEDLKVGNTLTFFGVLHTVKKDTACGRNGLFLSAKKHSNDYVFEKLGMGEKAKLDFCEKYYGYQAQGEFPEARGSDFKGLTKLVVALLELAESKKETVTT